MSAPFVCALLLLVALTAGHALLPPPSAARQETGPPDAAAAARAGTDLTPGKSFGRELAAGRSDLFRVALGAGQYARVTVDAKVGEVWVRLVGPDGAQVAAVNSRRGGPTTLSHVAKADGVHLLEVGPRRASPDVARYEVRFEEARAANERDGQRLLAEHAFAEAERLRAEWKEESFHRAAAKYDAARDWWRLAGERAEEARALRAKGEVYSLLGEHREAAGEYGKALAASQAARDVRGEADGLNGVGSALAYLGQYEEALRHHQRALGLSRAAGYRHGEAQALTSLGEVHYNYGDMKAALDFFAGALPIWRGAGDRLGEARTLRNIGYAHTERSELRKAIGFYEAALTAWRATDDLRGRAQTVSAMGVVHFMLGESQRALDLNDEAARIFRAIGDRDGEAATLNGRGEIHGQMGDRRRALEYYSRALEIARSLGDRRGELVSLGHVGRTHHSLGEEAQALAYYEQALALSRALSDRRLEAYWLNDIGSVYAARGEGRKALDYYTRALALNRRIGDRRGEVYALNNVGGIHAGRGDGRRARSDYERALALSRATEDGAGESLTLFNLSRLRRDAGDLADARTLMRQALEIVESLRANVISQNLRASYFASVRQYYELYIDVLMQSHRRQPTERFDSLALEVSERARARSLVELLAESRVDLRQGVDAALLERAQSLRRELNNKAESRTQLLGGSHTRAEAEALAQEIDRLDGEHDAVTARIKAASPHYAALMQPRPLSAGEIQAETVDEDALLLEYSLGEERSYLWAVSRTSIESYELPPKSEVEGAARRVRELLAEPQQIIEGEAHEAREARLRESEERYRREAAALGETLLGPVASRLAGKRLVVVADGALQYIPFGALPAPGRGAAGEHVPLMLEHEITSQPSASTLAALRAEAALRRERQSHQQQATAAPRAVAVFADPVFEHDDSRLRGGGGEAAAVAARQARTRDADVYRALRDAGVTAGTAAGGGGSIPRLFASSEEAEAIMAVVPAGSSLKATGFGANREAALSPELARYRIIHFATHGVLDSERPELSGLVLSLYDERGNPREGFLRLNDIYNLELPAEMVVLSACNTGLGKDVKGEGLVGLTRGFMHAGSARVMASLWKVDDEATAELMKHFYRQMLVEKKSPAAALKGAQTAVRQQRRWRAPYFWAAFVLQGEYGGHVEVGEAAPPVVTYRRAGAAAGAALAFIVCGGYFIRRKARHGRTHVH